MPMLLIHVEHLMPAKTQDGTPSSSRRLFFVYAPPLKGARPSKRKPPKPPYKGAPPWKNSVYYYWWEYLRRHRGYAKTCERGGKGAYAKLYRDFGDVHAGTFWQWWKQHQELFCEPPPPYARIVALSDVRELPSDSLLIQVSLEQRLALTLRQIKRQLSGMVAINKRHKTPSKARYPVHTKPVLSTLHRCLAVWDTKEAQPDWPNFLIKGYVDGAVSEADILEFLSSTDEERKQRIAGDTQQRIENTYAVSRDYRIAQQYIDNVALGFFPKRSTR